MMMMMTIVIIIVMIIIIIIRNLKISLQDAPGQPNYPKFKKCREKFNRECVEVEIFHHHGNRNVDYRLEKYK